MNSIPNSQKKVTVSRQYVKKAFHKLKYLIAFLALFWGSSGDNYNITFDRSDGVKKTEIKFSKDSITDFSVLKKLDADTTMVIAFHKES